MPEPSEEPEKHDKLLFDSPAVSIDIFGTPKAQQILQDIIRSAERRARMDIGRATAQMMQLRRLPHVIYTGQAAETGYSTYRS